MPLIEHKAATALGAAARVVVQPAISFEQVQVCCVEGRTQQSTSTERQEVVSVST